MKQEKKFHKENNVIAYDSNGLLLVQYQETRNNVRKMLFGKRAPE